MHHVRYPLTKSVESLAKGLRSRSGRFPVPSFVGFKVQVSLLQPTSSDGAEESAGPGDWS